MKKNRPLVSIIVPSYNVEKYVKRCLDSIVAQTYQNWECIIVDRPSTKDNTTAIIKDYIKSDKRFVFIEQANKGVSDGRNVGFLASRGDYIQFTDPDDWIDPNLIELSVEKAESTNADIVQFAWSNYYVQTQQFVDAAFMKGARKLPTTFSVKDHGDDIFKYGEIYINSMSKLWRRDFLERTKIHYPVSLKRAEDLAEVSRLVMNASTITYLDRVLYFYKVDEHLGDSLSNFVKSDEHDLDFYEAIKSVHSNMVEMGLLPKHSVGFCRVALSNSLHALYMSRFSRESNRKIFDCVSLKIFPMISKELKKLDPKSYTLFKTGDYNLYLQQELKNLYIENNMRQQHIVEIQRDNQQLEGDIVALKTELDSQLSVKHSMRLLIKNLKNHFDIKGRQ